MSDDTLTAAQLATLHDLAAVLTPAGDGIPSASEADPDGAVLRLALHHLARELPAIRTVLDRVDGREPAGFVEQLERESPGELELLVRLLVCRYLTCRPVWDLLGYDGRRPSPAEEGEAAHYLRDDILEVVRARGPRYVPTPPSP